MKLTESEFGKGLTYCLGLFLAHAERYTHTKETYKQSGIDHDPAGVWFNSAGDHLFEIQWEQAPRHLRKRIKRFADKCITWRNTFSNEKEPTEQDVNWAIQEAKTLLRLIDEANGIQTGAGYE